MSWAAGSLAIVVAALGAGFAWWERTRPPSRLLALVATLAALAVAGRIAFAPIPNVKPTTDIVLFAGFALGAAPGFATGAVTALVSNLFFGQGPWTPWQMVAWGLVGVLGAGLAAATRHRRPGRVTLAAACAVAGLGFGVIMDVYEWLTFQSTHTAATYAATASTSLPFNLAHVLGNVIFCLAFGPALVAALQRFRARLDVRWLPAAAAVSVLVCVVAAGLAAAPSARAAAPAASVRYLERAQNPDGGFGGAPGQASSGLHTGWAALGLAAAGRNPADVSTRGRSVLDHLAATSRSVSDLGEIERTILVLGAAGRDPRAFAGRDLVAELAAKQSGRGALAGRVNTTAFGVLALRAAGRRTRDRAVRRATAWLARQANRDGGFNFAGRGGQSGIDDTAAAVEGLVAGGRRGTRPVRRAVAFLRRRQNADGGFPLTPGSASNAQSTAFAVQGLIAAGRRPGGVRRRGSRSPTGYLRSLVGPSGAVRYSRTSTQTPVWVTSQVVAALAGRAFPLPRVPRTTRARAPAAIPAAPSATATATATATPGARARAERPVTAVERRGDTKPRSPALSARRVRAAGAAAALAFAVLTGASV